MGQPSITLFTDAFAGAEAQLAEAIAFAGARDAHLTIVAIGEEPPFSYLAGAEMAVEGWVGQVAQLRDEMAALANAAQARAVAAGLSSEARAVTAVLANLSRRAYLHGRYGDLSIVRAPVGEGAELATEVIDGLLFSSGRPVLILPEGVAAPAPGGKAVVAWDGSREAARALFDALGELKRAEAVSIALVEPSGGINGLGDEPGADIARVLARHGIEVTVDRLPDLGKGVAEALQGHAIGLGAGLLVMGGYGHSKLRETIFGGVTRDMLKGARLALFMSH